MIPSPLDRLYQWLPAFYREQDAVQGYPLRALLRIIAAQADLIEQDLYQLWDDLFIETCRPWVIPYLGDLVSNDLLYDPDQAQAPDTAAQLFLDLASRELRASLAARARADVARTIYYRRRKGTLPMLERLAVDVTGQPAHAVTFFELLGWTQHREHWRMGNHWAEVRSAERMQRIGGPFDEVNHTVDVRPVSAREGWHNLPNIGFFLWRVNAYPINNVSARPDGAGSGQFHFSPLGNPQPLFHPWRPRGEDAGLVTELHVPGRIRPSLFTRRGQELYAEFDDMSQAAFDPDTPASLAISCDGHAVPTGKIFSRSLESWTARPLDDTVLVDVERGRLVLGAHYGNSVPDVSFHYGFGADLGGGPYDRSRWLIRRTQDTTYLYARQGGQALVDALAQVNADHTVIVLLDSRTYALPSAITLRAGASLAIEAASGERPMLQTVAGRLEVKVGPIPQGQETQAALTLSGVVVEGYLQVTGDLRRLRLLHSTLIPGGSLRANGEPKTRRASVVVQERADPNDQHSGPLNDDLRVEIAFSITGPLQVPSWAHGVWLLDSIVEGWEPERTAISSASKAGQPPPERFRPPPGLMRAAPSRPRRLNLSVPSESGPPLYIERSTVRGQTWAERLEASESIFGGRVFVTRRQEGCVRFCFLPPDSYPPRCYRCQPELAVQAALEGIPQPQQAEVRTAVQARTVPRFADMRYGQPRFGQLHLACPSEISAGAEDGSEMGAFCHVKQPHRESNLRIRLREYLPFGLVPGIIDATDWEVRR